MIITKEVLLADRQLAVDNAKAWASRVEYIDGMLAYLEKPEPQPPAENAATPPAS